MDNFIKHIKEQRDGENSVSTDGPAPTETPYFIQLAKFKKEVGYRLSWIEEFMIDGVYEIPKSHIAWMGNELSKLYEQLEEIENKEKENCGCIHNISEEEFNAYLKSIGGLENGYGDKYWGDSKTRRFFFNATDWLLWRLPYYKKTKTFSKESRVRIFFYNIFYWMFKFILRDNKPSNPFRSMIYDCKSFSIGPGWYGLTKTLIQEAIASGWDKEVCQVKEKFATLRFYIGSSSKEVDDIISKYAVLSSKVCEECGEAGKVRNVGWLRTLCDKHVEKK